MQIDPEIVGHYLEGHEHKRLAQGVGELERLRTEEILRRYLPDPPATLLDVGGAAGVYALHLAAQGYSVHLIDPIPLHIEQAQAASAHQPDFPLASAALGDARALSQADDSADAILLLGPLYHLVDQADRQRVLSEAFRVLKPGGVLFGAAISRYASLLDGVAHGHLADPAFVAIVRADLTTGQHRNENNEPQYFTTAYFHRPEELQDELETAGFAAVTVLGVEGPAWIGASFASLWQNIATRLDLLSLLETIEQDPAILATSAHLMGVARK
ncbi:MAG: class I SAM-dependent methyltransferase [Candidatus Sericytochromatia bacterium]|nr:class I SAM-dependent methyltransferase [Candidatus Sericytochromatia bacterium]